MEEGDRLRWQRLICKNFNADFFRNDEGVVPYGNVFLRNDEGVVPYGFAENTLLLFIFNPYRQPTAATFPILWRKGLQYLLKLNNYTLFLASLTTPTVISSHLPTQLFLALVHSFSAESIL